MKKRNGMIFLLMLSFVLLLTLVFWQMPEEADPTASLSVAISGDGVTNAVSLWMGADGKLYGFLPSFADPAQCSFRVKNGSNISLDGAAMRDGQSLRDISLTQAHNLQLGTKTYELHLRQSQNVASLFLNTKSGSMRRITANKNNKEQVNVSLYTASGMLDYQCEGFADTLKGRGNSSWDSEKKPFNLNLAASESLLDMSPAQHWALLADSTDESHIRNKLVYDSAKQFLAQWSPDCRYVELYLNGEYTGLYLMAEKVEVLDSRLNMDPASAILMRGNQMVKWKEPSQGFVTNHGLEGELRFPEKPSDKVRSDAFAKVQELENRLFADPVQETAVLEMLDLDSWVRRYLIDETFLNMDAEQASAYFYWDRTEENGKIYAGPIWDYDLSMGNTSSGWSVGYGMPNRILSKEKIWLPQLNRLPAFQTEYLRIYAEEMKPLIAELLEQGIDSQYLQIRQAAISDELRWQGRLFRLTESPDQAVEALKQFLVERMSFLERYWNPDTQWHTVTVKASGKDYAYQVEDGGCFSEFPPANRIQGYRGLVDLYTRQEYDFSQSVTQDITLSALCDTNLSSKEMLKRGRLDLLYLRQEKNLFTWGPIGVFIAMGAALIWLDRKQNSGKRGR